MKIRTLKVAAVLAAFKIGVTAQLDNNVFPLRLRLSLRGLALIEILALWFLIGITMVQFKKIDAIAFYLFIPYWLWVSFATVLNYSIWVLNR